MKSYIIRITDGYGCPRVVTVKAYSVVDALSSVEKSSGEYIASCVEVTE